MSVFFDRDLDLDLSVDLVLTSVRIRPVNTDSSPSGVELNTFCWFVLSYLIIKSKIIRHFRI